ncbi:HNH endonuclease domain-containing protein [Rhizobium sp. IBUN]|uniref:HNH endonuclease domain-containing protein n=1 Tax=Rhizobium sp. IBUN TaxID=1042326 RepID=UPI000472D895|nr:HNH endonuclease domain-containing protein [Rhizobium sp. IBUN]
MVHTATQEKQVNEMNGQVLPDGEVEVERLAGLFLNTTQSYKFLFFRAILTRLKKSNSRTINFQELLAEMIVAAWWPVKVSHLVIGPSGVNDSLTGLLDAVGDAMHERLSYQAVSTRAAYHVKSERARGCLRYVPEALLSPWAGSQRPPLYTIKLGGIVLEEEWHRYLLENLPIVCGWADNEWTQWVQARNPNVPVNLEKLQPPIRRNSLSAERRLFLLSTKGHFRCVYTGLPVDKTDFALDHFLPHAFVGHDRIWNLAPVSRALNSAKGLQVPAAHFVAPLVDIHFGLISCVRTRSVKAEEKFLEPGAVLCGLADRTLRIDG